jgi:hypothetical protein
MMQCISFTEAWRNIISSFTNETFYVNRPALSSLLWCQISLMETFWSFENSSIRSNFSGHLEPKKVGCRLYLICIFRKVFYAFVRVISMVETIRDRFSPSLAGSSSVPIVTLFMVRFFMKRLLVISAASTAVVIARPLAFKVSSVALSADRPVIIART